MTNAERLIELFGMRKTLADAMGVDAAVVSRMTSTGPRGTGGRVPTHYNHRILEAARAAGLDMEAVASCLDEHVCPTCGSPLEPGRNL